MIAIIENGELDEIYNVAGGFEQKNIETVLKIIAHFYSDKEYTWNDYVDFSYSREGQDVRYALDDSKLRAIGWSPTRNFDDEISKIVNHYKQRFIW